MPTSDSAARASSRRCDSVRAAYSPRNSGWYSRSNGSAPTFASISRATLPRSRPETLQVTSIRREAPSRLISLGAGTIATSATSPSGTWTPGGRLDQQVRGATPRSSRTFGAPQTTTSKTFCSS